LAAFQIYTAQNTEKYDAYMKKLKYQIGLLFVFFSMFGAVVLLIRITRIDPENIITPIAETLESMNIPFMSTKQPIQSSLDQVIQTSIGTSHENFGVVIINLINNGTYTLNEHQLFQTASLYKLWIMATAYDQIKNGQLHENDILQQEIPILNEKFNISTENAELTEGNITLSVHEALGQMITISDNYAALLLSEKVRLSNVAKFLTAHGFLESKVGTDGSVPTTTPSDIAKFFTLLYKGNLVNKEYDEKMLDFLKKQQLNNKIPKNIPKSILIAHKTGELGSFTHDAGIVYTPDTDYVIVVLSESDNPLKAEQKIADISEAVYHYFIK